MNRVSAVKKDCCPAQLVDHSTGKSRIVTKYKEGKGDKGTFSAKKRVVPKKSYGPPANQSELIRQYIFLLNKNNKLGSDPKFIEPLLYFARNTLSLNSFFYLHTIGKYTDEDIKCHTFPESFYNGLNSVEPCDYLENLEEMIFRWKDEVGDAKDFIVWDDHEDFICVDILRVMFRELETRYFTWASDKGEHQSLKYTASVLNRISSFVWWGNRNIAKDQGITEKYWTAKMEEYVQH